MRMVQREHIKLLMELLIHRMVHMVIFQALKRENFLMIRDLWVQYQLNYEIKI